MNKYNNNPIGVLDSGVGGLTVLQALYTKLPFEHFIYWGDSLNAPYGYTEHSKLITYVSNIIDFFLEKNVKSIVIACNTISGRILQIIKSKYPSIIFISMIDNGLLELKEYLLLKKIYILGTESTIKEGYYYKKVVEIFPHAEIFTRACPDLVEFAEQEKIVGTEVEVYIETIYKELAPFTDCIILACTHFPIFLPIFKKFFSVDILLYNPANSVADALEKTCEIIGFRNNKEEKSIEYYTNGNERILNSFVKLLL